jgi:(1->4)-alpha-D-glucan 1-alpha-D-glucosylmutase
LWTSQVFKWRKTNRTRKRMLGDGRSVPDLNEEYLLYQTLVGTWPFEMNTEGARQEYVERIKQYMTKAVHEAKVNLSWINDDPVYVEALQQFVERILGPGTRSRPNSFLDQLNAFLPPIFFFGALNSLAQRLLMITAPGNPDIYQGMELWDLSLVDPDNRRPVDYTVRRQFLSQLDRRLEAGNLVALCAELLENYRDGRIKLWTTMQALRFRRDRGELFRIGRYLPLHASGTKRDHVISFAREHEGQVAITAVPRFCYVLSGGTMRAPLGEIWQDTEIPVPSRTPEFLENVFTGEKIRVSNHRTLLCRELFTHFPAALVAG